MPAETPAAAAARSKKPDTRQNNAGRGPADITATTIPYLGRRSAPRYEFRTPVAILSSYRKSEGMLWDMSTAGARIEKVDLEPMEGERLSIEFSFFPGSPPVQLAGNVVRRTETGGFAIEFSRMSSRMHQILCCLLPKVASGRIEEEESGETSYSGQMMANVGPELHEACVRAAETASLDLNEWLHKQLEAGADEELEQMRHDAANNHDPSTCVECRRKASRLAG